MYNQNGLATGAKWFFWLAIVILAGVFALGFNVKDAKWLNGKIASATAEQISVATDIERQKSELDLQILKNQTELQIARDKQQAEYEAAKQQQELNALNIANSQKADFRNGLYNTVNIGLMALMIAASVALGVLGINASFGLHKVLSSKAQEVQSSKPSMTAVRKLHRQPSIASQQAREREKREREKQLQAERVNRILKNSKAIWPSDNGKSEEFEPGDYPWVN